jgi:siroheme synthase-like protein
MAAPLYPVVLRVEGRPCLVVGGGEVAARKVAELVRCGAAVTVVAPALSASIESMAADAEQVAGSVHVETRRYRSGEAGNYRLVITATGISEVDRRAAADAEAAGVWVNSADDAEHCTFLSPAVHRDGPVCVAVSTSGASPAMASWLRGRVAQCLGPHLGTLAQLLERARSALRRSGQATDVVDWVPLLDGELTELVQAGRFDEARGLLESTIGRPLD